MVSRPLVYITLAFVSGLLTANWVNIEPRILLVSAAITALIAVSAYIADRREVFLVLLAVFLFSGAALGAFDSKNALYIGDKFLGGEVVVEGYISREPDHKRNKVVYELKVEKIIRSDEVAVIRTRALVNVSEPKEVYGYGDYVRTKGVPYRPGAAGNPGQFDYAGYLGDKGIWALLSVKEDNIEKIGSGYGNPIAGAAMHLKQELLEVNRKTMEPTHAAIVNGIVFGSRGEIDPEITEVFNETGIVHILAVSGLNVGLVAAGVTGLLGILNVRRLNFSAVTVAIIVYAYITGMGIAVMRAAIMSWIYFYGQKLGRDRDWPTTMAVAALIILAFSPGSLFEAGFQLSFAATWGILYIGPFIDRKLEGLGVGSPWIRGCLWVTLGAQLGTLPLIIFHFNIFSLVSILTNLLAVPLVGLILPFGISASLMGLLHLKAAELINHINTFFVELMMFIVDTIHNIPNGVLYVSVPPFILIVIYYLSLFLMLSDGQSILKKYQWVSMSLSAIFLISFILMLTGIRWGNNNFEMHVIDVGQGDSILIRFPNGDNMLVDTGGWSGEFDRGRGAGEVVGSYLRRLGINKLDALVLSHPHEDHCAGAYYLYRRFKIDALLVSPVTTSPEIVDEIDPSYMRLLAEIEKKGVPIKELFSGDRVILDPNVYVEILGPDLNLLRDTSSDINNNSLVMLIKYGVKSFLLTGDIEIDGQTEVMEKLVHQKVNVLKVPHHGSKYTLPEFIETVEPDYSVISVGRNSFGQPAAEIVEQCNLTGPVYRTDQDGLVVFYCDGSQIEVIPYLTESNKSL